MIGLLEKQNNIYLSNKLLNNWFEKLTLPVAPACNMMCNFCTKCNDCICNGNNPEFLSKSMTPRQALNWAISSASRNHRIKLIKIAGPGEPLFNSQTFEVLKRLNYEMPDYMYGISTNGLLLEGKIEELIKLNVEVIEVSMNAIFIATIQKLYTRIINDKGVSSSEGIADLLLESQIGGIKRCIEAGILVKVNSVYFPGVNDQDIEEIALKCRQWGVKSMCVIAGFPNGRLVGLKKPTFEELDALKHTLSLLIQEVEIKSFTP